jgi:uncharacterized membrane protein
MKGHAMSKSPLMNALIIVFAVIGLLAVIALIEMTLMHGSMMGRMGMTGMMDNFPQIVAACQDMSAGLMRQ